MEEHVIYEQQDRVATLTLNRQESLNSLDLATVGALLAGAERAVREGAGALIVTGAGRAFCSGADLSSSLSSRDQDGTINIGRPIRSHYNPLVVALTQLAIPTVMAVNGVAAGGGASLALCGDIVVAARSASFRQTFVDIGLAPDMGATWIVPRLAGRARARGMALLGEAVSAETAKQWGLIWDVVDDHELLEHSRQIASRLAAKPPGAMRAARRALDTSHRFEFLDQLAIEARIQTDLGQQSAFEDSVKRFLAMKPKGKRMQAKCERPQVKE